MAASFRMTLKLDSNLLSLLVRDKDAIAKNHVADFSRKVERCRFVDSVGDHSG